MRKSLLLIVALLAALLAAGTVAAIMLTREEPPPPVIRGSPTVEFDTSREPTTSNETPPTTTKKEDPELAEPWPTYGYDLARTHVAPNSYRMRPPYRPVWRFGARDLIEFPPTVAYGQVYISQIRGHLWAVDAETGKQVWHRWFRGHCQATSPTVANGIVYQPLLPKGCKSRSGSGAVHAINARTGKDIWVFRGSPSESTALVVDKTVYFGAWDNYLYALNARTGAMRWRFRADDELNGAPTYAYNTVYVGSDGGRLFAVAARSGRLRWQAEALRREYFYATPTVAYGRVFIGNTDGTVYAFGAKTGNLLWTQRAGTYVYTAPAVWDKKVYVGSYDGNVYVLDAATGDVRWTYNSPSAIHGAPTVLAGLVYFSTCGTCGQNGSRYAERGRTETFALNARTGKRVWGFPDGRYSAIVADEKRVYLVGAGSVYALVPCGRSGQPRCPRRF
jgi:outer membrane protein assembly factor BamB